MLKVTLLQNLTVFQITIRMHLLRNRLLSFCVTLKGKKMEAIEGEWRGQGKVYTVYIYKLYVKYA